MEGNDETNVESIHPLISVHNFEDNILGNQIYFHVIKLSESFHICVGTAAVMKNMAVAMQTKYVSTKTQNNAVRGHCGLYATLLKAYNSLSCSRQHTIKKIWIAWGWGQAHIPTHFLHACSKTRSLSNINLTMWMNTMYLL